MTYGNQCDDQYGNLASNHFKICCNKYQRDVSEGKCKMCLSCGGKYEAYGGTFFRQNDKVALMSKVFDNSCEGTETYRDAAAEGVKLCCTKKQLCVGCVTCGGDWP